MNDNIEDALKIAERLTRMETYWNGMTEDQALAQQAELWNNAEDLKSILKRELANREAKAAAVPPEHLQT